MWDLLDSGNVSILQSSFYGTKIFQLSLKLQDCIQNGSVEVSKGIVTKNKSYHQKFFKREERGDGFVEGVAPQNATKKKKKNEGDSEILFVPEDFHWYIQMVWEYRFITEREVKEYLKTLDHDATIDFLNDTMNKAFKPVEFDYSTACIFVIGNIDEAYRMSKNFDPDSDADRFYKHSLKITLPQIKGALQNRFRAEQIARLGNNHIIYPAFSSKVYKQLIELELNKVKAKVNERYFIDINFNKSIKDIIYKEGVFPTQGARPVFTTITSLIESYIGKIVKDVLEKDGEVSSVKWKFSKGRHNVDFYDEEGNHIMKRFYDVRLKVESLRQSEGSELQAQVAIHEAGHAVAAIYGANVLPMEVVSRTANMSEGHCAVEVPTTKLETKDWYTKEIIILLAGHVAEEMIFGENMISNGTSGDFEAASNLALEMAKNYGMLGSVAPMLYGHRSTNTNTRWSSRSVELTEGLAEDKVLTCKKQCRKILEDNKYLLLKIGEYLSTNSRMDRDLLKKFVEDFGNPVDIKDKSNYFTFKKSISDAIESIQKEEKYREMDADIKRKNKEARDMGFNIF